jgi:hypothetical protein
MSSSPRVVAGLRALAVATLPLLGACDVDPYQPFKDEHLELGSVDPINFPPENLGDDGDRTKAGSGSFTEIPAAAAGAGIGYFLYPVNTPAGRDPLLLVAAGKANPAVPTVYAFDPTGPKPVQSKNACTQPPRPAGGSPLNDPKRIDPLADFYRQQGNIFTALPTASYMPGVLASSTYVPVVAEAPVSSKGQTCQQLKSEKGLTAALGKTPKRDGKYLAWLIIDPAAPVYSSIDDPMMEKAGLGTQKWGWFNRYLLAYLDGGYIPTDPPDADPAAKDVKMVAQKLYYPASPVTVHDNSSGMDMTMTVMPQIGQGFDVLSAKRGDAGYSPICEVWTYDAKATLDADMLPGDAATIEKTYAGALAAGDPPYVYCLQVR